MNETYWALMMVFVAMPLALLTGIVIGKGIATLDEKEG